MAQRFVVQTDCPTCGAPLDFTEGSNAIRCAHCRSNLLVTGRKQVLSYWIKPKVAARDALQLARFSESHTGASARFLDPQLWFLPYYRLTGHDFRWVRESIVQEEAIQVAFSPSGDAISSPFSIPSFQTNRTRDELRFKDRHIEKNFIGCRLNSFGAYSIGVRAAVLKLHLFEKSKLESLGKIAEPDLQTTEAMDHGLKSIGLDRALHREVVGRVLSLLYFPFWMIPYEQNQERQVTIVDGVSQNIIGHGLPGSILAALHQTTRASPPVIGFRPLACPNCGWDLPLRPDDVVFVCNACHRAWSISADRLLPTRFSIAKSNLPDTPQQYLPHWAFEAKVPQEQAMRRFLMPAFRYRRLKLLADLATNFARTQPVIQLAEPSTETPELQGCFFDSEDASLLCRFIAAGLESRSLTDVERFPAHEVRTGKPVLLWLPFREGPHSLYAPFVNTALPRNLLL